MVPVQLWSNLWNGFYPFPNSISFYNDFLFPIMRMIVPNMERVPRVVQKFLRPTLCYDEVKLSHNWGDILLFGNTTIMRLYGCTHPPYILPRFVLERLGILEFFQQLILMDREHLGQNVERGNLLCIRFKIEAFKIGKQAINIIDSFLSEYMFPCLVARICDSPCGQVGIEKHERV